MEIQLKNKQEFISVLKNYTISDDHRTSLGDITLVLLVGITGSGKNAIMHRLSESGEFHVVVSDTTRPPRAGEQNGREYWFRSEADVLADLRNGRFVEAALIHNQQVSGTNTREFEEALSQHKIALNEVDVMGIENFLKAKPDIIPIFLIPPSIEIWQERLHKRGEMSPEDLKNRLKSSLVEIKTALEKPYYHFLINDNLEDAIHGVRKISKGIINAEHDAHGRQVAQELLKKIETMV
ncbi:MAG: hypothetical protein NTX11_02240 [Candidatus Saccharibacteria bacterium]|nr:hypothetical protein [Candidatus Saccharibacteria bacterium]